MPKRFARTTLPLALIAALAALAACAPREEESQAKPVEGNAPVLPNLPALY